eukprot:Colp12_sorted_trinity150504_noHs@33883
MADQAVESSQNVTNEPVAAVANADPVVNNEDASKEASTEDAPVADNVQTEKEQEEDEKDAKEEKDEHFTSEIYKVAIHNMPLHVGPGDTKKFIKKLGLDAVKVKKINKWNYGFVTFRSEEAVQHAMETLQGAKFKGCVLRVSRAAAVQDPYLKRKREEGDAGEGKEGSGKKAKTEAEQDSRSPEERLQDAVTPLWRLEYSAQLESKAAGMRTVLDKVKGELRKLGAPDAICEFEKMHPSPTTEGYRNKCEFSLGPGVDGLPTVGFMLGMYKDGVVTVGDPSVCRHVSAETKAVVAVFQEHIRQGDLPIFDRVTHKGFWRLLTVRESQGGEVMAIVQVNPQGVAEERLKVEREALVRRFAEAEEVGRVKVTSLMWQEHAGRHTGMPSDVAVTSLVGPEAMTETLLGLSFRVSPTAFFQVNCGAAEVLYSLVREWCMLGDQKPVVLDICCGTGTIGLTMASTASHVLGAELVASAIEDAKSNAALNNITNVSYVCGRAEDTVPQQLNTLMGVNAVGIVDPPRSGLHQKLILALRKCSALTRLVYVSCDAQQASQNFVDLCRPTTNRFAGTPFRVVRAAGVDLFPHTKHSEMVLLLERVSEATNTSQPPADNNA